MAEISFEVKTYQVTLWRKGADNCAMINCVGSAGELLAIRFIPAGEKLPNNYTDIEKRLGHIYVFSDYYVWYLDLLRNSKPILAILDDESPDANQICHPIGEPVGGGEF